MGNDPHNKNNHLSDFYQKKLRKFMKYIPILGIVLLFAIYASKQDVNKSNLDGLSFTEKSQQIFKSFTSSFNFSDIREVLVSIILSITLWTGYKYWGLRLKTLRNNYKLAKLLEKLIIITIFLIFTKHIVLDSAIGKFLDWILFLVLLYLVLAGSLFVAKFIDVIDLRSDLYCWGLRIIGGISIFFGAILLSSSVLTLALANSKLVLNNIYWILSICIILLGLFCEFRSMRRYPMIHIW